MRIILATAALLAGCTGFDPIIGPSDPDAYTGKAQRNEMEALGLKPTLYVYGMSLVPCLSPVSQGSQKLTVQQRLEYRAIHGGYLADCGEWDAIRVWG